MASRMKKRDAPSVEDGYGEEIDDPEIDAQDRHEEGEAGEAPLRRSPAGLAMKGAPIRLGGDYPLDHLNNGDDR